MPQLMDVKDLCKMYYRTDEPKKSQLNAMSRMLCNGVFGNAAFKIGKKWFVDYEEFRRQQCANS